MLRVGRVVGPREDDHARSDEAARLSTWPDVSSSTTPAPSHTIRLGAEVFAQVRLDLASGQSSGSDWG